MIFAQEIVTNSQLKGHQTVWSLFYAPVSWLQNERNVRRRCLCFIKAFKIICSQFLERNRIPFTFLRCSFYIFNRSFLHEMTFNPLDPNLSCNALYLSMSVGSNLKLKTAASLSKVASAHFPWVSFSGVVQFFQFQNTV